MRSDVFLPTPGIAVSRATSPRSMARTSSGGSMPGEHRQRELRPDAADPNQPLEQILLEDGRKAVQRQRVLADVRVNAQRDLAARLAETVEGRQAGPTRRSPRRPRRRPDDSDASRKSGRADMRSRDRSRAAEHPCESGLAARRARRSGSARPGAALRDEPKNPESGLWCLRVIVRACSNDRHADLARVAGR